MRVFGLLFSSIAIYLFSGEVIRDLKVWRVNRSLGRLGLSRQSRRMLERQSRS